MNFVIPTDPRMAFAFWLGVCVVALSLVLLLAILVMRQWVERSERLHQAAARQWRQILVDAANGRDVPVPKLPRRDLNGFVDAWNELHDAPGVTTAQQEGMAKVAAQVGLQGRLYQLVDHGGFHNRVMAIMAMGHLKSQVHFDKLVRLLGDNSPIISISAARALMKIDPGHAVRVVVPRIIERNDWVEGGIAQMLDEAGANVVAPELSTAALQVNDDIAPRLVRFLADVDPEAAMPVIRKLLSEGRDEHLVSTCLQVMHDDTCMPTVRQLLGHSRWHVRMHAATAVGKFGGREDVGHLQQLLADPQWWVRYRSAQAIRTLVGSSDEMERIRRIQSDRFANDILEHVIAEQALGAAT
ncbi:HEAT repeat domain-containing protein [Thermomonas sp. HDW16]|uniref:HEAT repeat domain-containing protein n=1 Tax=Thermomonas sp. HDW16 TaxID=2714945 RepID=UPI00140ACCFD|nr:HEAT repeat domain-containing protein [Thermomonas sp. HDW16]QIL19598.1 HEAT repeat domain-containing protein [Thermomonas sp. HDW16]